MESVREVPLLDGACLPVHPLDELSSLRRAGGLPPTTRRPPSGRGTSGRLLVSKLEVVTSAKPLVSAIT